MKALIIPLLPPGPLDQNRIRMIRLYRTIECGGAEGAGFLDRMLPEDMTYDTTEPRPTYQEPRGIGSPPSSDVVEQHQLQVEEHWSNGTQTQHAPDVAYFSHHRYV